MGSFFVVVPEASLVGRLSCIRRLFHIYKRKPQVNPLDKHCRMSVCHSPLSLVVLDRVEGSSQWYSEDVLRSAIARVLLLWSRCF